MAAGERLRLLPPWMREAGEQRPAVAPLHKAWRPRLAVRPRAAAVIYCMNEEELVDEALAVLAEELQFEEGEEKALSGSEAEQELQLALAPGSTLAPESTATAGGRSDRSPALPSCTDADTARPGWEDSEDDALKYVREIFFR